MIRIDGKVCPYEDLNGIIAWLEEDGRFTHAWATDTPELHAHAIRHILQKYGNSPKDSFVGLMNMFKTMKRFVNYPGVIEIKDAYKDKPCVIALTGPSLTKQLPHLKNIRGNVCLIAPDVSLSILESNGIIPDYVCALERGEETTDCLKGTHQSTCVIAPVVPPSFYDEYDGPIMIAYRGMDHFKWLPFDKGWLSSAGIVGNMCFDLAQYIGCSPIVLIGADHAYDGTKTYAAGMKYGEGSGSQHELCTVAGYYGGEVQTAGIYRYAREVLEGQIKEHEVWNCTEGGAMIKGALNKPFDTVRFDSNFTQTMFNDYKSQLVKWYPHISKTLTQLQDIVFKADVAVQGLGKIEDAQTVHQQTFLHLVLHVAQAFMILYVMEHAQEKLYARALRDTVRRIRDGLVRYA